MTEVTRVTVPSGPDWWLCTLGGAGEWIFEPIIAWDIERIKSNPEVVYYPTPMTANPLGFSETANIWAIKRPDGRFYTSDGSIFHTIKEVARHLETSQ